VTMCGAERPVEEIERLRQAAMVLDFAQPKSLSWNLDRAKGAYVERTTHRSSMGIRRVVNASASTIPVVPRGLATRYHCGVETGKVAKRLASARVASRGQMSGAHCEVDMVQR